MLVMYQKGKRKVKRKEAIKLKHRLMDALYNLLDGSSDNKKFEE